MHHRHHHHHHLTLKPPEDRTATADSFLPAAETRITNQIKSNQNAAEAVILQLNRSKCLPPLLYGLEACPLRKPDSNSLDFVVNRPKNAL